MPERKKLREFLSEVDIEQMIKEEEGRR